MSAFTSQSLFDISPTFAAAVRAPITRAASRQSRSAGATKADKLWVAEAIVPPTVATTTSELAPELLTRRERNREHARRSRERKRLRIESLQREIEELRVCYVAVCDENRQLRAILRG